jgi:5S rRNA maturation endonuclease (ribonuclease M5)
VVSTKKHRYIKEYEELLEIIKRIIKESEDGSPIIVEGEKDLKALRALGVKGPIIVYRSREDLMEKINMLKPAHVILLLDMDYEGEEKTIYLKKFLEGLVSNIDLTYWNILRKFRVFGLTTIESIPKILDKMVR